MSDETNIADLVANGLHVEEEPVQYDGTLQERKARSKAFVDRLVPIVRVALGATVVKELWQKARNKRPHAEKILLEKWVNELLSERNLKVLHKRAIELSFFPKDRETKQQIPFPIEEYLNEDFKPDAFSMLKAINRALQFSNYGSWMKKQGFAYVLDSDHKMTRQMITGELVWTQPTYVTFSWREATTQEDYISPFSYEFIDDPTVPGQQIRIKKYRRAGNAYHTVDMVEINENNSLLQSVSQLTPGQSCVKEFDPEMHTSEFLRQAESEVAFVDREMQAQNVRIWPIIDEDLRRVVVYNAGNYCQSGAAVAN